MLKLLGRFITNKMLFKWEWEKMRTPGIFYAKMLISFTKRK